MRAGGTGNTMFDRIGHAFTAKSEPNIGAYRAFGKAGETVRAKNPEIAAAPPALPPDAKRR